MKEVEIRKTILNLKKELYNLYITKKSTEAQMDNTVDTIRYLSEEIEHMQRVDEF